MDPNKVRILSKTNISKVRTAIANLPSSFRTGNGFMPEEDLEARLDEINGVEIFPKQDSTHECTSICLPDNDEVYRVSVWKGDSVSFVYKKDKYMLSMRYQR